MTVGMLGGVYGGFGDRDIPWYTGVYVRGTYVYRKGLEVRALSWYVSVHWGL